VQDEPIRTLPPNSRGGKLMLSDFIGA
jgi:hypothetical protein